ncbi:MAG: amidohydrolase family protein, partial [Candidatus Thorarchaeota archaeon]
MPVRKLIFNGPIITMNENQPRVEAVGIEDEKIISVGKVNNVKKDLGTELELIDLKGRTLLPGFIDSHMHPISFLFLLLNLDLSNVKNLKELQELLKQVAVKRQKGELIYGLRLKEEKFDIPKLPTRWDLDEVCPEHPVFIIRYDGHIGIANSKILEMIGINSNTMTPE